MFEFLLHDLETPRLALWAVLAALIGVSFMALKALMMLGQMYILLGRPELKKYRHIKSGKVYVTVAQAKHSETLTPLTIYSGVGEGGSEGIWARPTSMFHDGRFERV